MNRTRSAIPAIFILTVAVIASMNSGKQAPVQRDVVKLERVVVVGKRAVMPGAAKVEKLAQMLVEGRRAVAAVVTTQLASL